MAQRKSDKEQRFNRAFNRYQQLIEVGLEKRRKATQSEVVTLRSGIRLLIGHTEQGYAVLGLAAQTRIGEG